MCEWGRLKWRWERANKRDRYSLLGVYENMLPT